MEKRLDKYFLGSDVELCRRSWNGTRKGKIILGGCQNSNFSHNQGGTSLPAIRDTVIKTIFSGQPYNNRVERIARGQHGLCSGRSMRSVSRQIPRWSPAGLSLRASALRPCSPLTRALYGQKN